MDNDNEYYDSLEEDDFPELLTLRDSTDEANDISQIVPLYGGETTKSEVMSFKSKSHVRKARSKLPVANDTNSASSSSSLSRLFLDLKNKKSYVDLFHAKIGYVQGSESTDTTRALCDTDSYQTARSSAESLDYSDAASFVSDSSSFYMKFLENEKAMTDQLTSISCRSTTTGNSRTNSTFESTQNLISFSRSNQNVNSSTMRMNDKNKLTKGKYDKAMLKVPTLGGLGPDREAAKEKLERFKRQQRYGQKVSNQNRMKIMETKVMKNFKYELKKSNDLNKCAESVLGS